MPIHTLPCPECPVDLSRKACKLCGGAGAITANRLARFRGDPPCSCPLCARHEPTEHAIAFRYNWNVCKEAPTPSADFPSVCRKCGRAIERHKVTLHKNYGGHRSYMWSWFLKVGAVHSFYGMYEDTLTWDIRQHMLNCKINLVRSEDPRSEYVSEFSDTESDPLRTEAIQGILNCMCGFIDDQEWTIVGATMGEVLFATLQEQESPEGLHPAVLQP